MKRSDLLKLTASGVSAGSAAPCLAWGQDAKTGPAKMPPMFFDDGLGMHNVSFFTGTAVRFGAYLHPYHNMFVNAAMTEADVDATLAITDEAFDTLRRNLSALPPQPNERLLQRLAARRG